MATGRVTTSSRPIVPNRQVLQDVAARTGGLVYDDESGLPSVFVKVLNDFHTSYVLRYMPRDVKREGWHDLAVKLRGHEKYEVHARKGYQGG